MTCEPIGHALGDAYAEAPTRPEHARGLTDPDRASEVVNVHQRVVGDHQIERAIGELERVGEHVLAVRIGVARRLEERRRHVDGRHAMAPRAQFAADATLAAADLERCDAGLGYKGEEVARGSASTRRGRPSAPTRSQCSGDLGHRHQPYPSRDL